MPQAVSRILGWVYDSNACCRIVVTPNVDHVVQLHLRPELKEIYRAADMTLADGWPLVSMSRLFGRPLPERVAGSDLLPELCQACAVSGSPLRLFLLGGMPGVAERAKVAIESKWTNVSVVGHCSPPLGFEGDAAINRSICDQINDAQADLLIVGLGFPKQELWMAAHRSELKVPVALGLGATIDFLAGEQVRAPRWMQRSKLEWLHRLASNPRRLVARYATDAIYFPWICWGQWRDLKRESSPSQQQVGGPQQDPVQQRGSV
ncbi:WecB/TagA/CpsF family glycosyltransferase [Stieleria sp. TO1_6]|uniref:WecB/TagA/CpsF family glycosyltransferase n=1 Tax=Stieleria tagensis TaxID=2956795 RepID=UPI00209AA670|nr:WecB/TagA/CpsF family glycosyltransferase [Stieleria tagensis]MCO8120686.1 WecB/TagA/CpsF family glycosyltransferase [Stieleria tagensis]